MGKNLPFDDRYQGMIISYCIPALPVALSRRHPNLEYKDVIGKEGSKRLRFELLNVINFAIAPVKAHTVLFKGLIIQ